MDKKTTTEKYFWCLFKSMSHMLTIGYGVNQPAALADLWVSIYAMFSKLPAKVVHFFISTAVVLKIQKFRVKKSQKLDLKKSKNFMLKNPKISC